MKKVSLTFDDIPTSTTIELMNALKKEHVPATFFIWGERIEGKESLLKLADRNGFSLGNHTYSHGHASSMTSKEILDEIRKTDQLIVKETGNLPLYFRPPYGEYTKELKENLKKKMVLWDIDSLDWKTRETTKIIEEVVNNVSENAIVLMHDLPETIAALPEIIDQLRRKNFEFVPLDNVLFLKEY